MIQFGRRFYKMSGSGNDFIFVDARNEPADGLKSPDFVASICKRGSGIGADGIVFLENSDRATIRLVYLNSDGSHADLCGNATLCTARLARELGVVGDQEFSIETHAGILAARFGPKTPEIDLPPIQELQPDVDIATQTGEQRIGFAMAGIPHLVVLVADVDLVDVVGRGRPLRRHPAVGAAGANVNFVQPGPSGIFRYRTYERGVEGETLACGTGAVATAALVTSWGLATGLVRIQTRSGKELAVRFSGPESARIPSLSGEARIVFQAEFGEPDRPGNSN